MQYVFKLLDNFVNVNSYTVVDELQLTRGNAQNLYFQLYTATTDSCGCQSLNPYIPTGTPTYVEVFFRNFDYCKQINRVGVPANAGGDCPTSIYYVPILSTDKIPFNGMIVNVWQNNTTQTTFLPLTDLTFQEIDDRALFT